MYSLLLCLACLLWATPSFAAWFQIETATSRVMGIRDTEMDPVPGHTTRQDPRFPAANYPWPIPPGCTEGRREWSRVTTFTPLRFEVRPDLLFFECQPVETAEEVDAIVADRIVGESVRSSAAMLESQLAEMQTVVSILRECPMTDVTPACADKRTAAGASLNQMKTRFDANRTLRQKAAQFKQANGL